MLRNFHAILILVLLVLPLNHFAQETNVIDLTVKEKKPVVLKLSEIATGIEYIPLETTKESYLTGVFQLIKTDENLLVLDYNNMKYTRLLIFNLDGSFKAIIEEEGKGPGEYVSISDFSFDPNSRLITILDSFQRKVLQFNHKGEFVREKVLDIRPHNIAFVEPDHFCFLIPLSRVKPEKDGKLYNLFVMDRDFNLIERIPSPMSNEEPKSSPILHVGGIGSFNGQLRLKIPFSETTYTFNKKLGLEKIIHFEMGKYKLPASIYSSLERSRSEKKKYKSINGFVESNQHFFFKYRYQNKSFAFIKNKNDDGMINLSGKMGNYGIINDFDGSMKFWPKMSTAPDELVQFYNAIDLIEYCDKNKVRKYKSKFPDQQKKFLNVLNRIDEESNPIVQVVRLK